MRPNSAKIGRGVFPPERAIRNSPRSASAARACSRMKFAASLTKFGVRNVSGFTRRGNDEARNRKLETMTKPEIQNAGRTVQPNECGAGDFVIRIWGLFRISSFGFPAQIAQWRPAMLARDTADDILPRGKTSGPVRSGSRSAGENVPLLSSASFFASAAAFAVPANDRKRPSDIATRYRAPGDRASSGHDYSRKCRATVRR